MYILLGCNIFRKLFAKIRFGKRYQGAWIERISNSVTMRLFDKGKISLGYNLNLDKYVDILVSEKGELEIGDRTYMNRYCMISCHGKISIGKNCMFGPSVYIFDNNHKFEKDKGVKSELSVGEISIGDNCWLASNVVVLKGAKIGKNCVIGAGCVIDGEIPDNTLVKRENNLKLIPIV